MLSKTKNLLLFLLVFQFIYFPQFAYGSCESLQSELNFPHAIETVEVVAESDFQIFQVARDQYANYFGARKNLESQSVENQLQKLATPTNISEALGLLASLEAKGLSGQYDFERFYEDVGRGEKKRQKSLVKELKRLVESDNIDQGQLYKIAELMYFMANDAPSTLAQYEDIHINHHDLMAQRFNKEITTHALIEAMSDLGFVRDPKTLKKIGRASLLKEILRPFLFLITGIIPHVRLLDAKLMDQKTFDTIYTKYIEGGGNLEAIRPMLQEFYGIRSKFDFTWLWISKVYATLALSVMITMAITETPAFIRAAPGVIQKLPAVAEHLENYTAPILLNKVGLFHLNHKSQVQEILFNNWLDSRTFFTGRRPTPADPSYQAKHKEIYESPDIELYFSSQKE